MIEIDFRNYDLQHDEVSDLTFVGLVEGLSAQVTTKIRGNSKFDIAWLFSDGRVAGMYVSTDGCETCGYGSGTFYSLYTPKNANPSPQ